MVLRFGATRGSANLVHLGVHAATTPLITVGDRIGPSRVRLGFRAQGGRIVCAGAISLSFAAAAPLHETT